MQAKKIFKIVHKKKNLKDFENVFWQSFLPLQQRGIKIYPYPSLGLYLPEFVFALLFSLPQLNVMKLIHNA